MNKKPLILASLFVAGLAGLLYLLSPSASQETKIPLTFVSEAVTTTPGLQPGANVLPYEIHNTASGEEYCQMCAYAERAGTVAAYGNLNDEGFWSDLAKLQDLQNSHKNFGFFGQVLDSKDAAIIAAQAKKHQITLPIVYAVDPDWNSVYKVGGISRTIYYSNDFKMLWTNVGLDGTALAKLNEQIKSNPRG